MKKRSLLVSLIFLLAGDSKAWADNGILFKSQREAWASKGLTFALDMITDYVSVYKGGLVDKDTWMGRFDFTTELDLGKAGLLKGGLLHLDFLNVGGGMKPTADRMADDLQTVNNIEATRSSRIYEGWYQQSFFDNEFSVKFGLIDLNAEFLVSDSGNLFINSSLNTLPAFLIDNNNVALYPEPAPAVRLKYSPNERFVFLAGFFQGNTLNSDINAHSTHFGEGEGLLSIEEGQYHYKLPVAQGLAGVVKAGFWYNSKDVADVSFGNPTIHEDNYGAFAMFDQAVFRAKENQGLNVFFFGGGAPRDRNTVQHSVAAGLNYTGLIPCRPKDVAGIALTESSISNKLRAGTGQGRDETTYEWTYQIQISDSIQLQPDIQYVQHPGANPGVKNASVFTLRTQIQF
jgi:porin